MIVASCEEAGVSSAVRYYLTEPER